MADEDDKTTHDEQNDDAEETETTESEETDASSDDASSDDASSDDASSDDEEPEEEPKPKKKVKKKRTKKRTTSSGTAKKKTRKKSTRKTPKTAAPAPTDEDDNGTMMALGAFVLAILAIGGLWWWNSRGAEEEVSEEDSTVEPAEGDESPDSADVDDIRARLAEAMGEGNGRPPGPPPIPPPADVAAAPENASTTDSGLAYRVIEAGTGDAHPGATDRVTVHYTGWTTDGEMFDSSRPRGEPASFALNRVIPGWTEAVQLMVVAEQTRFWIPQDLAYRGRPGAPAGMLVFDVELISFEATPQPPPAPDDVAEAPSNATTTESGLAYRVIEEGTGTVHPGATDRVSVNYTGWTTDGESFDSTVTRGRPAQLQLNRVIPGWTEGVPLMVVGERTRFWIPQELAYAGRQGAPPGMLVFDIELVEILPAQPPSALPPGHPGAPPTGAPPGHGSAPAGHP